MAASRTQVPLGRLSRPKTIFRLPVEVVRRDLRKAAKAADMRETTVGVREPPMVPRMPEMPIISSDSMVGHYEFAGIYRKASVFLGRGKRFFSVGVLVPNEFPCSNARTGLRFGALAGPDNGRGGLLRKNRLNMESGGDSDKLTER